MNNKINDLVCIIFDDIPYSPEISLAQEKITAALNMEYEKLCTEKSGGEALDELLLKYGTLTKMAELAGYTPKETQNWRSMGDAAELKPVKKIIRKQRRRAYLASLFAMFSLAEFFWVIYHAINRNNEFFFMLTLFAVYALLTTTFVRKIIKTENESKDVRYDNAAFEYLRALSDQYIKRLFHSIVLLIGVAFIFTGFCLSFYLFGNSKSAELGETIFSNILMIEFPFYLLVKNIIMHHIIRIRINLPDKKKTKIHGIIITAFSLTYWIAVFSFTIINRDRFAYPANIFLTAGIIFVMIMMIYNFTARRTITYKNIVFNPHRAVPLMIAAIVAVSFVLLQKDTFYTQPYINSVPVVPHNTHKIDYNEETGVYTITSSTEDFKILHLTDIHIGGSLYSYTKDMKALKACYAEIEHTRPDLVIVTDDLCFPLGIMSMSLNNAAPVQQFAAFMRNTGIPWAFTYGNHDTESLASLDKKELNDVYKSLSYKTSGTLLYPYVQPDITGRNNQLIELRNTDGSLNTGLFLIDSNAYTGEGINVYDYIHDDQVDWYAKEVKRMNDEAGRTVNSFCFFHIPLQEYRTATELYNAGSDKVKYFFGENPGDHGGITNDLVCCSDYPSKLFDTALKLGSTTGMFCGHDHYNNASIEYKGIRLTYGMSIDYLAMPGIEQETSQRGAELITIHPDSSWDLEQIPLTSIT